MCASRKHSRRAMWIASFPHGEITAARMAEYPGDKVFVVYCASPHCNGANEAALRLARLGFPVKIMIGGVILTRS
jgi:rhodanese-related sulfurtransferase